MSYRPLRVDTYELYLIIPKFAIFETMKILKYLPFVLIPITIICNALFETMTLFGTTSKQISDVNQILLTPSPITFSIWGVIYLFLIIHLFWSFKNKVGTTRLQILVSISMVFNIVWLMIWHAFMIYDKNVGVINSANVNYNFQILSLALVTIIIYCLIIFLTILEFKKMNLTDKLSKVNLFGMGIHFSWVTLATLLNLSILIKFVMSNYNLAISNEWETMLAMLFITLVVALSLLFVNKFKILAFGIVSTWALFGMLLAQPSMSNLNITLILGAVCCVVIVGFRLYNLRLENK